MDEKLIKLCQKHRLALVVLFGSQTTGKTHRQSDYDIAVLPDTEMIDRLRLIFDFGEIFAGEIDLVVLTKDTDPTLLHEIFFTGKLIYENEQGLFHRQQLRAWHIYQDTEKLRRLQDAYLHQIAEGIKKNVTTSSQKKANKI